MIAALRHRVGRRGSALLFFAFLDLVYCYSLLAPSRVAARSPSLVFVGSLMPLWAWGLLWGGVGAVCAVSAFRHTDGLGFSAAMGLKMLWGLVLLGGWAWAGVDRGYVSAAVWLALAGWVWIISGWPEPPTRKEPVWIRPPSS